MAVRLYGFWRSLASYRVRVALALKGIAAEQISIDLLEGKQHTAEYKAINPQSVVPALVVDGAAPLFQSMAILEYLEETHPKPALLPKDSRGRARVRGRRDGFRARGGERFGLLRGAVPDRKLVAEAHQALGDRRSHPAGARNADFQVFLLACFALG